MESTDPSLANQKYIIDLLQKYELIDENITPTWRAKYLTKFFTSTSLDNKISIEVKLEKFNRWMRSFYSKRSS